MEKKKSNEKAICRCLKGHIAYCEGNYKKLPYNHLCLYDATTEVIMKTPPTDAAFIYETLNPVNPLPTNSVIAIEIEFYSCSEEFNGKIIHIYCAARIVVMTKVKEYQGSDNRRLNALKIIYLSLHV